MLRPNYPTISIQVMRMEYILYSQGRDRKTHIVCPVNRYVFFLAPLNKYLLFPKNENKTSRIDKTKIFVKIL